MSDHEDQLRELGGKLVNLYGPADMMVWLFSPHRLLDEWAPAALIQQRRTREVIRLVDQLLEERIRIVGDREQS